VAGRDGILTMKDGILRFATSSGDETSRGEDVTAPYLLALRDVFDHWRRGAPPPIGVQDLVPAVRLIDAAYERAGGLR